MTQQQTLNPNTLDTVRQMIGRAQAGDLAGARTIGKDSLPRLDQTGPVHAILGRMACEAGDFGDGIVHLREALVALPREVAIRSDLAAAFIQTGDFQAAIDTCDMAHCAADNSLQLARFRGYAAQQIERWDVAIEAYRLVVDKVPDDAGTWNNLGNAEAGAESYEAAVESLRRAVELDPQAIPSRLNYANALIEAGNGAAALAELERSARDFPSDPYSHLELGRLAASFGNVRLAIDSLEQADRLKPGDAEILVKLAGQRGVDWDIEGSKATYRQALDVEPNNPDAFVGLAMITEQDNRADELSAIADDARRAGVEPGAQSFIDALYLRREKRWEEGLAAAEAASDSYDPIRKAQLIGEFNDRLGRADAAFAAFGEMNRLASESPHEPLRLAEIYRQMVAKNAATMTADWVASWTAAVPPQADERPSPTFLLGFPRSGTTLLDTMLMGDPSVRVLEEKPPLPDVDRKIGEITGLASMSASEIRANRDQYWADVDRYIDVEPGSMVVDKSPLYLNKTAIIHRLFPDARYVLALRHPMDVVLSCFVTNFRPNAAMSNFLDLRQAAELYDQSMAAFFAARDLLDLPTYTIVYERMIEDRDAELKPLFDWLGLDWRAEAVDHQATAAKRGVITTASYAQVHEPLYKRSAGRWVRYREQLKPIEPILAPWIERFGYSLDQPEQMPTR